MGNAFGEDLELEGCPAVLTKIKMIPVILTSILFRCLSFVAISTFLRWYAIIPTLIIWFIGHNTFQKVIEEESWFLNIFKAGGSVVANIPYEIISITVGPILVSAKVSYWWQEGEVTKQEKADVELKRRKLFFFDSIGSFLAHGLTLMTIFRVVGDNTFFK